MIASCGKNIGQSRRMRWGRAVTLGLAVSASAGWVVTTVTAAPKMATQAKDKVEQQLAFGEFASAIATAQSVTDARQRGQLLQMIADAQWRAGDAAASQGTTRQIDDSQQRATTQSQQTRQQAALEGGISFDFQGLIQLIEQETSGPWQNRDGEGGTASPYQNGVSVNPNGLLTQLKKEEHAGRLKALGIAARKADLNADVAKTSSLRFVSLTRMEREATKRLTNGQSVVETMKNLAGLTQIKIVVVIPEEHDILIGGTAEAWKYDANGNAVGAESGRPMVQLDDLVVVLRTFSGDGLQNFGCSFNPRQEGLKQVQQFVEQSQARGPLTAGAPVNNWVKQIQSKLGPQDIELWGVPRDSRVARVVTEADYRLKMIGIGKMEGGSHVPSIFELMSREEQTSGKLDALRWWLTMKYDAVLHSPDHNVFEIQGPSVQCLSENQFLTAQGERVGTGKADATNQAFARNFTQHYAELARRDIAFADLQNVFDLALVAALLKNEGAAQRAGWDYGAFSPSGLYQPAVYAAPQEVESVANHRVFRGKDVVVQVAGGVRGDLMSVVKDPNVVKSSSELAPMASRSKPARLADGRWWWDAQ